MEETPYAWNGEISLAYQSFGEGPPDLIYLQEQPAFARFLRELARLTRVVVTDRRGLGGSERFTPADTHPLRRGGHPGARRPRDRDQGRAAHRRSGACRRPARGHRCSCGRPVAALAQPSEVLVHELRGVPGAWGCTRSYPATATRAASRPVLRRAPGGPTLPRRSTTRSARTKARTGRCGGCGRPPWPAAHARGGSSRRARTRRG